jgi:hypothetical protein
MTPTKQIRTVVKTATLEVFLHRTDVIDCILDMAATEETDVRERMEQFCKNLLSLRPN